MLFNSIPFVRVGPMQSLCTTPLFHQCQRFQFSQGTCELSINLDRQDTLYAEYLSGKAITKSMPDRYSFCYLCRMLMMIICSPKIYHNIKQLSLMDELPSSWPKSSISFTTKYVLLAMVQFTELDRKYS